ncbi:MAG: hypothetical protein ACXWC6_15315 [Ramlibacter sp.]
MAVSSIPNAELIQAVLEGQVVQVTPGDGHWTDMDPAVAVATLVRAAAGLRFRLKPRAMVAWLPVYRHEKEGLGIGNAYLDREHVPRELPTGPVVRLIRLELDPNSLETVTAVSEAP